MLGINDVGILSAYLLCIISAIVCLMYGIYNWNKGQEEEPVEILEEIQWEKAEHEIEDVL
ncbi:MAG: symporter small accessory protein [Clostridia bacterium]